MTDLQLSANELHSLMLAALRNGCKDMAFPLDTAELHSLVAAAIRNGLRNVALPLDTIEFSSLLVTAARNGSANARLALINPYQYYIFKAAARYARNFNQTARREAIQSEFWLYAYDKIDKYDPTRAGIATFLEQHFRNAMGAFMAKECYPLAVSHQCAKNVGVLSRVAKKLRHANLPVTDELLADATGFSVERVRRFLGPTTRIRYLDAPLSNSTENGEGGAWLEKLVADAVLPLERMIADERKQLLRRAFGVLTVRETLVIRARFALNGQEERQTLDELGEQFEISKERVRQIEAKALRKLKAEMNRLARPPVEQMLRELELA